MTESIVSPIGEASRRSGVHIETIRYYERAGLVPAPMRSESGRRMFREADVDRLRFVRHCRDLGLPLGRIRELLGLVDARHWTCDQIRALVAEQVSEIRERIDELRALEDALTGLSRQCAGGQTPDCAFIATLFPSARPKD